MSGTKQLHQPEKPVVYIVPITSILGRLPLIPAGDHDTIPAALRGRKRELFPLGKCDEDGWQGTGSRLYYISSWAMCWPTDHPKRPVSRVCTKSAKSASGTLGAYFVLSMWYSNADLMQKITYLLHTLCILCINFMHTMCRLCETCDLGGAYPPKSLLHLTNSQGAACLPQRVKSQLAWPRFGARWTPSATAGFGAGGARHCM